MLRKNGSFVLPFLIAAALGLSLSACSSSFRYPGKSFFTPERKSTPVRAAPAAPIGGQTGQGESGADGDPSTEVGGWLKAGISQEEGLADSDACYSYANAQVSKDIRIDRDIDAARGDGASFFQRSGDLDRGVDAYYYENQRVYRFESCMRSRGYTRN